MDRRVGTGRRPTRAGGGGAGNSAPFVIVNVPQTAGTIDGGTVITMTATRVLAPVTCSLGAVSGVTTTLFVVTVRSGTAGAFEWDAENGDGAISAPRIFTYLAHPVVSAIVASGGYYAGTAGGPVQSAQSVTITCAGLPASGAGVTVTVTVGGVSCTSVTLASATTLTCSVPSGGTAGANTVVVTVDGVASTGGTGLYTIHAPPAATRATAIAPSSAGATFRIEGTSFSTPTATTSGSSSVTVGTTTSIYAECTMVSGLSANTYDLTVTNADGQTSTLSNGLSVTTTPDPMQIAGTAVFLWLPMTASDVTLNGSNASVLIDRCGTQQNIPQANATNQPVYNASGSSPNATPSITGDGSTKYMQLASWTRGGSTKDLVIYAVTKGATSATGGRVVYLGTSASTGLIYQSAAFPGASIGGQSSFAAVADTAAAVIQASIPQAIGGTMFCRDKHAAINTNTVTTSAISADNKPLTIMGGTNGADHLFTGELFEVVILNSQAVDATVEASIVQYLCMKHGITMTFDATETLKVLANVATLTAVCRGAGGGGGATANSLGGGGGGGGGYASGPESVSGGTATITVGVGGAVDVAGGASSVAYSDTGLVSAAGGAAGADGLVTQGAGGAGGAGSGLSATVTHTGGTGGGGGAGLLNGGGGGGGAGSTANGSNGNSNDAAGAGGATGGGNGAVGAHTTVAGTAAVKPGGGGGGASTLAAGSAGAAGQVRITFS